MAAERPPFRVDPEVLDVLKVLWSAGHAAYLVGGGVRDAILGLDTTDWDVATDARPEQILKIFPGSSYQNRYGTVLARGLEITTFRRDHRYADHRRPERVTFTDDVYEDLARRDFTINAIAWGRRAPDAEIRELDPADGRGDLVARVVRAVGDPGRRFDEDALRLLRAVRIAARLDFSIEPMTHAAIRSHAGDIAWVSEERVSGEVRRMLADPRPSRAFRLMDETGILSSTLPELAALRETEGPERLEHALAVSDGIAAGATASASASADVERLALAALLHPLGPEAARNVLRRLRIGGRETDAICHLIDCLAVEVRPDWSDAEVRRYMRRVGTDRLDELFELRRAHDDATTDAEAAARLDALIDRTDRQRAAGVPLTLADLAIDGADLRTTLGIPESPTIGAILDALLDDVIEEPRLNSRTTLITRASLELDRMMSGRPSRRTLPATRYGPAGTSAGEADGPGIR